MSKKFESCPCCESNNFFILYSGMFDKSHLINFKKKFNLMICENCGLKFLEDNMDEEELSKYYPSGEYYAFNNVNKLALIYHQLAAKYHSGENLFLNIFMKPFASLFHTYYINHGKKILEIGCGDGMKLEIYKKYGLKTKGLEPYGEDLTKKEKELGIQREAVKNAKFEVGEFDYIILRDVLEHVPNQKSILAKCHSWLNESGKLIITVPNTDSLWAKKFRQNWHANFNFRNCK